MTKNIVPKDINDYYKYNNDSDRWDKKQMTCRQGAKFDVAKYQLKNVSNKLLDAYESKHPDKSNRALKRIKQHPIPHYDLATILVSNYYFASTTNTSSGTGQLMYYCDNQKDSINFGTYISNYSSLNIEIKNVFPPFRGRDLQDIIADIQANTSRIKLVHYNNLITRKYIAVNNGLFNKKTHKLENFTPELVFTAKILTNYNPNAKAIPHVSHNWSFENFLKETVGFKQYQLAMQILYDALDGNTNRNRLPFLIGKPHTGKSTFLDIITEVINAGIGNNVATTKLTEFGKDFGLAPLRGTICDVGDNISTDAYINETASSTIHSLVTGDPIDVNVKYKNPFSFSYQGTIISTSNGYPRFADGPGIKSRLLILKFFKDYQNKSTNTRGNDDVKTEYIKLRKVREHILYTVLNQGNFKEYRIPDISHEELERWDVQSNPIKYFASQVFGHHFIERIPKHFLYDLYKLWAKDNGYQQPTLRMFNEKMDEALSDRYTEKSARFRKKDAVKLSNLLKIMTGIRNSVNIPTSGYTARCYVISPKYKTTWIHKENTNKAHQFKVTESNVNKDRENCHYKEKYQKLLNKFGLTEDDVPF